MASSSERTLPHSIEAEKAVLGAVLAWDEAWAEVAVSVTAGDFFREAHQKIWQAIGRLKTNGVAVDLVTLTNELKGSGDLESVGGPVYVASLPDGVPRSTNVEHYAEVVKEKSRLRSTISVANVLLSAAYDNAPSARLVEDGIGALLGTVGSANGKAIQLDQAVMEYVQSLDTPSSDSVIPTGFRDLDDTLAGGVRKKTLTIVAARPSVGKTSLGLGIALNAATAKIPSAVFSLEMSRDQLAERIVSWESKVGGVKLRSRQMNQSDFERLGRCMAAVEGLPFVIEDVSSTLAQVSAWVQRLKRRPEGLSLVVVDYLQLLVRGDSDNRRGAVAAVSNGLKRLAKEQDVAVVALSQLSREPEARKDKRPQLSDLRDSGELEQDADVVILLFREEMYTATETNAGIAEAIVAKQRSGPTGVRRLCFLSEYAWFTNLATEF